MIDDAAHRHLIDVLIHQTLTARLVQTGDSVQNRLVSCDQRGQREQLFLEWVACLSRCEAVSSFASCELIKVSHKTLESDFY